MTLGRRLAAEALGTALLLATVIGSGIMGERLASGNVAIALLANSIATGAALYALILVFAPVSGAHTAACACGDVVWLKFSRGGLVGIAHETQYAVHTHQRLLHGSRFL